MIRCTISESLPRFFIQNSDVFCNNILYKSKYPSERLKQMMNNNKKDIQETKCVLNPFY